MESGNAVTSLEGLLNVLSEADCYTFGRKINEKLPKAVRQSEDEINSNIETGNKILTAIRENCGLIVYALDKVPEAENGTLKIGSVKYTLYLAKDYETVDASGEFKQQNRWVLADADGDMIVVGGGTYKGTIDSWWDMQKTVFKAPDLLIKYGSDAVKLEVKPE
ncbi:MAG: hypothetical protein II185_03765 [Firmicutes bacterium]|nr:hypothetical protein [Bacillota bacterium]